MPSTGSSICGYDVDAFDNIYYNDDYDDDDDVNI